MNESTPELTLSAKNTALILIDLQNGIVGRNTKPYAAAEIVDRSRELADALRQKGGTIIYVRVDINNFLQLAVDEQMIPPNTPPFPESLSEIVLNAGFTEGDLLVTKRHWGAFAGTNLEELLRERGIETVLLGGIATNMGVESTVRQGTGLGFSFVLIEDICSGLNAEAHSFAFTHIFPSLSRVRSSEQAKTALV